MQMTKDAPETAGRIEELHGGPFQMMSVSRIGIPDEGGTEDGRNGRVHGSPGEGLSVLNDVTLGIGRRSKRFTMRPMHRVKHLLAIVIWGFADAVSFGAAPA
jgi:hypothetical protein